MARATTPRSLLGAPCLFVRADGRASPSRSRSNCAATLAATLLGVGLNAWAGWWQADPIAGLVIAALAVREGLEAFEDHD